VDERKKLVDGLVEVGGGPSSTGGTATGGSGAAGGHHNMLDSVATSAMIEKEKHKLEVLKRRQEREIQQVRWGW